MIRFLVFAAIAALSSIPAWADNPPQGSPLTRDVLRLTQNGVEDSVVIAFVNDQSAPIAPEAEDYTLLKTGGASSAILSAIARHDAQFSPKTTRPVTEAEVYRLFGGLLYHRGSVYGVGGGLPEPIKQDLLSDPQARDAITSSSNLKGTALGLIWGGLGTTVGGAIFAGVSQTQGSPSWGPAVGFSAVGLGVVSMIVGSVVDAVSYHDLYKGLYQYNEDLIQQATGGKS